MANITSAKTGAEGGESLRAAIPKAARALTKAANQDEIVRRVRDKTMRSLQPGDIELESGETVTRPMTHVRGLSVRRQLAGRRSHGRGGSW